MSESSPATLTDCSAASTIAADEAAISVTPGLALHPRAAADSPSTALPARIPSLDGLRALSIAVVISSHVRATVNEPDWSRPFLNVAGNGRLGVSIFFVISGFLITTLLLREYRKSGRIDLRAFFVRRVFRILPPAYVYIGVVALLGITGAVTVSVRDVLTSLTFLVNYVGTTWSLGHIWSLSVEEQFYVCWPLVLMLAGKRWATVVAIGLILGSPGIRLLTYWLLPDMRGHMLVMGHTRMDTLIFGCLAALWYNSARFQAVLSAADRWLVPMVALVALCLSPFLAQKGGPPYLLLVGLTVESVAITILLLYVVRRPGTLVGRILNFGPIMTIGVLSYSLYLWQQLFLTEHNTTWTGQFPQNIACSFAAATASFVLVERPALRLRKRLTEDRRPAGPGI